MAVTLAHSVCTAFAGLPAIPPTDAVRHVLPNGLTIIVREDRSAPVASLQAWCGTGSIHEGEWMGAGLSHILEHMLFKGTETRQVGQIARQIEDQGGMINAYTSFDRTVYWIDVPSSGALEALDILADAMLHSTLPESEYAKEQEVIRREFAMGFDDPERQSSQLMLRTVFGHSPFRHPVIGYLDVYNKLTRDDVMAYYRERYVPNNLTFVVVGDVSAADVIARIEKAFAGAPRRPLEPVFVASEPEQLGRRDAHEEFAATELTRLFLAWRIPGLNHPDTPALDLLGEIVGGGRSSPLNVEVREKQRLAHQIAAGMFTLQTDGVFVVQAVCDPGQREAVEAAALEVIGRLQKDGPEAADLDKAKRSLLAAQLSGMQTARGQASDLGSNWLLASNLDFSRHYLESIAAVTPEDVQRVATEYLRPERLSATSLNPPGSLASGEEARHAAKAGEAQMFTLPNGLRVVVREDPRLPLVSLHAAFRGGVLAEEASNNGITKLLARTLLKGTKSRSAQEIASQIEGVGGRLAADAGNNSWNVAVETMAPDLALGMELLADVLLNPTFAPGEVEIERQTQLAAIKAEDEQVTAHARNLARAAYFGGHPYGLRASGSAEAVAGLDGDALRAFHREVAVARNGVLAVFGDVKAGEVKALAAKYFGSMPEGRPAFENLGAPTPPAKPVEVERTADKQQAILMFAFPAPSVSDRDSAAIELITEASNHLGSRFFDRIREQMGLAYFVGAAGLSGPVPGCLIYYLGTDPAKLDKVTGAFRDEIAALAAEGLTAEELARAKKKALGEEAIQNQSNPQFAAKVALDELLGLGYDYHQRRAATLEAVTIEDTKAAAAKYLGAPGYVRAIVAPARQAALPPSAGGTTGAGR